ncbi:unnamed protein product [Oreochromis niloticus]|nr:unnamed protein product [Mustela putorius furo]
MSASVPSPPPFLQHAGEPPIPFMTWRKFFENYMLVINATGDAWPEARRRAVLLHCLGPEGQRLFYTLPNQGTTFAEAMTALENHFVPKVNVVACRHTFRQRVQRADETVTQYVAALRALAVPCGFGIMEGEMIRDQLVANANLSVVKDKLLLEEDLTLDKAVTIACQVEAAVKNATLLSAAPTAQTAAVQAVEVKDARLLGKRGARPGQARGPTSKEWHKKASDKEQQRHCFRCGSQKHLANDKNCPAVKVKCDKCNKKGHFARVCKSAVAVVREVVVPEFTVLCVDDHKLMTAACDKITCKMNIETLQGHSQVLELIVDTGASVSILPEAIYKEHFAPCALTEPKVKLVTYAKGDLPVIGCLQASVRVANNDRKVPGSFFIVKDGSPLLGLDLIKALNIDIIAGKVINKGEDLARGSPASKQTCMVNNIDSSSSHHLGAVKGFVHKVQVNKTVQPVRQKLRRLPLSIREEVSAELKRLLQAGIIEPVDAAEWVSPLVVGRKSKGDLRLCVDLREPNKSVIMDCYPLPHMEDVFSQLAGATHFSQIDLTSAYHQLPLHPDSRSLTAFITHEGLFQFTRVPFGLASAPSAFQKMMQTVLRDQTGVQNYLDDIIVYGHSREEHDERLQAVLQRLKDAGLQINFNKSSFGQTSIPFLGHVISKDGLSPSPDHLTAIAKAPAPKDMAALRSFLGLTSWFSKFLPNYATVVEPLRELVRTSQTAELQWTDTANESFNKLKEMLLQRSQNFIADCMSRVPLHSTNTREDSEQDLIMEIAEISPQLTALPLADFKAECEDCPELTKLRQIVLSGWPKVSKSLPDDVKPYFLVRHELAAESPLIFRGTRLIVPKSLRGKVVHLAQEGHQGMAWSEPNNA